MQIQIHLDLSQDTDRALYFHLQQAAQYARLLNEMRELLREACKHSAMKGLDGELTPEQILLVERLRDAFYDEANELGIKWEDDGVVL